jgi:hypothetical protein
LTQDLSGQQDSQDDTHPTDSDAIQVDPPNPDAIHSSPEAMDVDPPTPKQSKRLRVIRNPRPHQRQDDKKTPKFSGDLTMRVFDEKVYQVVDLESLQV